jgi:hypothetical protein
MHPVDPQQASLDPESGWVRPAQAADVPAIVRLNRARFGFLSEADEPALHRQAMQLIEGRTPGALWVVDDGETLRATGTLTVRRFGPVVVESVCRDREWAGASCSRAMDALMDAIAASAASRAAGAAMPCVFFNTTSQSGLQRFDAACRRLGLLERKGSYANDHWYALSSARVHWIGLYHAAFLALRVLAMERVLVDGRLEWIRPWSHLGRRHP